MAVAVFNERAVLHWVGGWERSYDFCNERIYDWGLHDICMDGDVPKDFTDPPSYHADTNGEHRPYITGHNKPNMRVIKILGHIFV